MYATRIDADGNVKHKARYVIKCYSQKENVDCMETFSPTAHDHMTSVRILVQTAVNEDMVIHQMNVNTAYAPIGCHIYVRQPEGYKVLADDGEKLAWHSNKSLYRLKQSGRNWDNVLNNFLVSEVFTQMQTHVYISKWKESQKLLSYFGLIIYIHIYIILAASSESVLN